MKESSNTTALPLSDIAEGIVAVVESCRGEGKKDEIPFVDWRKGQGLRLELIAVSPPRPGAAPFFYEMARRVLFGVESAKVEAFYAQQTEDRGALVATLLFVSESTLRSVEMKIPLFLEEIRIGLLSPFNEKKILEMKGVSPSDKMTMVMNKLRGAITRFPSLYDYDVVSLMQRFFVSKSDGFISDRSVALLTSLVLSMYHLGKKPGGSSLKKGKRRIDVRARWQTINDLFGEKSVLLCTASLSLLKETERCAAEQIELALRDIGVSGGFVEESHFGERRSEGGYVCVFELSASSKKRREVIELLELNFPDALEARIEHLARPLVIPRNEEEVMKQLVVLSRQLSSPRDIPQMIISFDEQTETSLYFTVLLARVIKKGVLSASAVLNENADIVVEKARYRGMIWKKFPKEVAVLKARVPLEMSESDPGHIDYAAARLRVSETIASYFGEVRDYYGGMLEKQKKYMKDFESIALEKISGVRRELVRREVAFFFESISPPEYKCVISFEDLTTFFSMYLCEKMGKERRSLFREGEGNLLWLKSFESQLKAQELLHEIQQEEKPSASMIFFYAHAQKKTFVGFLAVSPPHVKKKRLRALLQNTLEK